MNDQRQSNDVRNDSENFGTVPHHSESFRIVPNDSEPFGNVPKESERKEYCTLSVREVAKMFETAGVARTERSIVNWCQQNKLGVARLDNYFDTNERKYFISPQSVEKAIEEEKAKAEKNKDASESFRSIPTGSERKEVPREAVSEADAQRIGKLEKEVIDLKILNSGKDYFIDELRKEREAFALERKGYVEELMSFTRRVGELETRLLQLEPPKDVARHLGPALGGVVEPPPGRE